MSKSGKQGIGLQVRSRNTESFEALRSRWHLNVLISSQPLNMGGGHTATYHIEPSSEELDGVIRIDGWLQGLLDLDENTLTEALTDEVVQDEVATGRRHMLSRYQQFVETYQNMEGKFRMLKATGLEFEPRMEAAYRALFKPWPPKPEGEEHRNWVRQEFSSRVREFQGYCCSEEAKKKKDNLLRRERKALGTQIKHIDRWFEIYPDQRVVHLSLERGRRRRMHRDNVVETREAYEQLSEDCAQLMRYMRSGKPPFEGLVGYLRRIHCEPTRGFSLLLILFFDAASVTQSAEELVHEIGEYWLNVGRSGDQSVGDVERRAYIHRSPKRGDDMWVGDVSANSPESIERLQGLLNYFASVERYVRYQGKTEIQTQSDKTSAKTRTRSLRMQGAGDGPLILRQVQKPE